MTISKASNREIDLLLERALSPFAKTGRWGAFYLKCGATADIERVEAARWKAHVMLMNHSKAWDVLYEDIRQQGEIFFIPNELWYSDPYERDNAAAEANGGDAVLKENVGRRLSMPVYGFLLKGPGLMIETNESWWDYAPPKHREGGHALDDLAEVGHLVDWEAELETRKLQITDARLALGRRYIDFFDRRRTLERRCRLLDTLLDDVILARGDVPVTAYVERYIVRVNTRDYWYQTSTSTHVPPRSQRDRWPLPEDGLNINEATSAQAVNDSLVGLTQSNVLVRLGRPEVALVTRGGEGAARSDVWIYGNTGLCFERRNFTVTKILKKRAVARLLKEVNTKTARV